MKTVLKDYLFNVVLGVPQKHKQMTVFPILNGQDANVDYMVLSEALELNLLKVAEISETGSVPDLKVINDADKPVLLLDGEELVGAKQNRVLNSSILLKEKSETIVPVSCTEQGRWSYNSEVFADSGTVMSPSVRLHKTLSVSHSLRENKGARSDQGKIWQEINKLSSKAHVNSATDSMRDVFESRQHLLDEYTHSFSKSEKQTGLLVIINNKVVGFDIVSRAKAFEKIYPKLLKSYAMDAILSEDKNSNEENEHLAREFFQVATLATQSEHDTVGYGKDYRFTGNNIVGSALVHDKNIVHIAFFRNDDEIEINTMANSQNRRKYRL